LSVFFFKQKTEYEIPKRDWSSDVCSSDLVISDRKLTLIEAINKAWDNFPCDGADIEGAESGRVYVVERLVCQRAGRIETIDTEEV